MIDGMKDAVATRSTAPVAVGCDGTDGSDGIIGFAIQEAWRRGTGLSIVTAFERPIDPDIDSFDVPEAQLERHAKVRAEALLARAVSLVGPAPDDTWVIAVDGRPGPALAALGTDGCVIVVGGHHGGVMSRVMVGSTGREVIKHAKVPVIVLPRPG